MSPEAGGPLPLRDYASLPFCVYFETGSDYVALAVLELTMQNSFAWNPPASASAESKGTGHCAQLSLPL